MVRELFDAIPDPQQDEILEAFPTSPRIAMKGSKGSGKTCPEAWLAWNFLLTRPHPKIAATSISAENLADNLWTEMAHWQNKSKLLQSTFTWTKTRIFSNECPETWWMSARSWSKTADKQQQSNTLAGLHAEYILFILDESGGIPDAVMASAEAALASCKEGHLLQGGNPTHLEGPLYRACTSERRLWRVVEMTGDPDNPKRSPRVSIEWARQQIEKYGRDNPWVLVNVFGQFPPSSLNALLGPDDVSAAMGRQYQEGDIAHAARILGVDVAREGDDCFDATTEILTDAGWKLFSDLRGTERVLSMEKDCASWEAIDQIHQYDFDGELNLFEKTHLNFCVTDKHRFLVKTNPKSSRYCFKSWRDLPLDFIVRSANNWGGISPASITFTANDVMPHGGTRTKEWTFDYLDWATLLGWFVSEGNVYREKRPSGRLRVGIAQIPGEKRDQITALLKKMGLKWQDQKNGVEFSNNKIGQWLIDECLQGAHNKRVPKVIKDGSPEAIKAFLDSFLLGDGTCRSDGTGRAYITSSKTLADDLQEMLAKIGRAGLLRLKERAGSTFKIGNRTVIRSHDTFVLYERLDRRSRFGKTVNKRHAKRVRYTGKIWCVSTRFQSIYVRRKGVPMWSGNSSVIFPRQGLVAFKPHVMRNVTGNIGAGQVSRVWTDWDVDAVFIDNTGGFGSSWIDQLANLKRAPIPVGFSESALDRRYFNRRAEMYFLMANWVKGGGALPNMAELTPELTQTSYSFRGDALLLEPKDVVKAKIGRSPDLADALALTFAAPVAGRTPQVNLPQRPETAYDPYAAYTRP